MINSDFFTQYQPREFPLSFRDSQEIARAHKDLQLHSRWFPSKFYIEKCEIVNHQYKFLPVIVIDEIIRIYTN